MKKLFPTLLLLAAGSLHAEWKFSGQAGSYVNNVGIPSSTVTQGQKAGIITDFKLDYKSDSPWKFKFDTTVRTDFVARDAVEFFQLIPKNAFLQRKYGSLNLKVGLQTLSIDGPDIINPADVVHAKNWIDPTSPLTMGSAGISMSQEINEWNWEVMYIPRQTTPTLPGAHSPWLPRENRLPIESQNLTAQIPNNVQYQYQDPVELNHARDNNVAFKVQRKSENFEMQLLYYNGLSQSPFLLTEVQGSLISVNPQVIQVDSTVKLQPLYYRQQAYAGTFMIPFESWAIRGGFNWLKPEGSDARIPKDTKMMVIGAEKSVETSLGLVTGIVDYIRQDVYNKNQISFLRSLFQEAVSGGLRVPFGEETTFMGGGIYDLVGHSSVLKVNMNRRITNSWSLDVGAQFLQGPDDTMIGIYKKYDSYMFKLMYSW